MVNSCRKGRLFARIGASVTAFALAMSIMFATPSAQQAEAAEQTQKMYRLFNRITGEHLYTSGVHERDVLSHGDWVYEGVGWVAPKTSTKPVYRLFSPISGDHHYTMDAHEVDVLTRYQNWRYEGIGWYSDTSQRVAVWRQFNPRSTGIGSHHYTTGKHEYDVLTTQQGWVPEGIGWYAIEVGTSPSFPTLKSLGLNYSSLVDSIVDSELKKLAENESDKGRNLFALSDYGKATAVRDYIGSYFVYGSSYDVVNFIRNGSGTCWGYSELMFLMAKKLGINAHLTVSGRHVDHGNVWYGSQHRSVVVIIGSSYYDFDANLASNYIQFYGVAKPAEQIHPSYANYLLGNSNSYTQINP